MQITGSHMLFDMLKPLRDGKCTVVTDYYYSSMHRTHSWAELLA